MYNYMQTHIDTMSSAHMIDMMTLTQLKQPEATINSNGKLTFK